MSERTAWAAQFAQVKRLHNWVLEVERLLDAGLAKAGEMVNNETVGSHLDAWREEMTRPLTDDTLTETEQKCLTEFLRVLSNLRP